MAEGKPVRPHLTRYEIFEWFSNFFFISYACHAFIFELFSWTSTDRWSFSPGSFVGTVFFAALGVFFVIIGIRLRNKINRQYTNRARLYKAMLARWHENSNTQVVSELPVRPVFHYDDSIVWVIVSVFTLLITFITIGRRVVGSFFLRYEPVDHTWLFGHILVATIIHTLSTTVFYIYCHSKVTERKRSLDDYYLALQRYASDKGYTINETVISGLTGRITTVISQDKKVIHTIDTPVNMFENRDSFLTNPIPFVLA